MSRFFTLMVTGALVAACGSGDQDTEPDDKTAGPSLTVIGVTPARGPLSGGTDIVVSFSAEMIELETPRVLVGDRLASDVTLNEDGTISAVVPEGSNSSSVAVTVFSESGYGSLSDAFVYNAEPVIDSFAPVSGAVGSIITIEGSGFQEFDAGDSTIMVGDQACEDVVLTSDTEISCTAATLAGEYFEGQVLSLSNANGTTSAESFSFVKAGLFVSSDRNTSRRAWFYVDPEAPASQPLPMPRFTENIRSIALGPDGVLYGNTTNSQFATIDIVTGEVEIIAQSPGALCALTSHDGDLFAIRRNEYSLYEVDVDDGSTDQIALVGGLANNSIHSVASFSDSEVIFASSTNTALQTINVDTGAVSLAFQPVVGSGVTNKIRSLTKYGDRILGIREESIGSPRSGGGSGGGAVLVEIDVENAVITDLFALPLGSHKLTTTLLQ